MNGVADGGSADTDTNDSKDVSGRHRRSAPSTSVPPRVPRAGLASAIAGSRGRRRRRRAPDLQNAIAAAALLLLCHRATPAVADGIRTRYSPLSPTSTRPFGGWAEYVHSEAPVRRGDVAAGHRATKRGRWPVRGCSRARPPPTPGRRAAPRTTSTSATGTGEPSRSPPAITRSKSIRRPSTLGLAAAGIEPQGGSLDSWAALVSDGKSFVHVQLRTHRLRRRPGRTAPGRKRVGLPDSTFSFLVTENDHEENSFPSLLRSRALAAATAVGRRPVAPQRLVRPDARALRRNQRGVHQGLAGEEPARPSRSSSRTAAPARRRAR